MVAPLRKLEIWVQIPALQYFSFSSLNKKTGRYVWKRNSHPLHYTHTHNWWRNGMNLKCWESGCGSRIQISDFFLSLLTSSASPCVCCEFNFWWCCLLFDQESWVFPLTSHSLVGSLKWNFFPGKLPLALLNISGMLSLMGWVVPRPWGPCSRILYLSLATAREFTPNTHSAVYCGAKRMWYVKPWITVSEATRSAM